VEAVPVRRVLRHQVRAGQLGQQRARLRQRRAGEARDRRRGDVRARVQAQQPEQPGRLVAQLQVRPREHGAHVGGDVGAAEHVQAAQFVGNRGQREPGMRRGPRGDHGERQRQPGAPGHDPLDGGRLGGDPPVADALRDQLARLVDRHQIEDDGHRALADDQPAQRLPAGDHGEAAPGTGQQRPHLLRVAGVVEDHQHPALGEDAAVQRHLRLEAGRDPARRHLERVEQRAHRLGRGHRRGGRVEAAQVDEQLAVREAGSDPVRPVHRQRGLPDSGRARDDDDRNRRPAAFG
jgi:hypothetical protein